MRTGRVFLVPAVVGCLSLTACVPWSGHSFNVSASASPSSSAGLAALLPAGASVLATKPMGANTMAVLAGLPGPPGTPSIASGPPAAELAVVASGPAGSRLMKAVTQPFAQVPTLDVQQVGGQPAAGMAYHTGANSAGLLVVRAEAVVYDGVADNIQLQDVDGDGSAEVVKDWSPFCQSHAASPRLTTVYAWQDGAFVPATGKFPTVLAKNTADFRAADARANNPSTTPAWTAGAKACLHDSLAYLASLSGDGAQAAAERAQVQQLDPSYDVDAIAKAAASQPAKTSP
ncbi:MAG: hypothetical protein JO247_07420 [Chloroflexi bacterium]|nr:hypothetical protein [Chloroflexota bacterium]